MSLNQSFGLKSLLRLTSFVDLESKRYRVRKSEIYLDMLSVYLRHGIGPNYYLLAGFSNPETTKEVKSGHLNARQYNDCLEKLNPGLYRKITQNKLSEKAYLTFIGAPISKFIGYFDTASGFTSEDESRLTNSSELKDLLKMKIDSSICFKLLEGWGGRGFIAGRVVEKNGEVYLHRLFSDIAYTAEDIVSHFERYEANGTFLLEEYINQDSEYCRFNNSSINTVRVWTLIHKDGVSRTVGANFRVGRKGSLTDNGDSGGIMCPVNIDTGVVGPGILTDTPFREELLVHPDTGAELAGQKLKGWDLIKELCEKVLPKLPKTRFAGFDIAMRNDGPVIVEINVFPDKDGAAYGKCLSKVLRDNI